MTRLLAVFALILLAGGCYVTTTEPTLPYAVIDDRIAHYGPVGSEIQIGVQDLHDRTLWVMFDDIEAEIAGTYADGVTVIVPAGFVSATIRAKVVEPGMEDEKAEWLEELESWMRLGRFTTTFVDDSPWLAVQSSHFHSCGIKADHSLWCWGDRKQGQMGTARTERAHELVHPLIPVHLPGEWDEVSVPDYVLAGNSCGRQLDGGIWCWGDNMYGPFPADMGLLMTEPTQLAGDWDDVQLGGALTCGRKDGELYCWTRVFEDSADLSYLAEPQQMGEGPWASYAVGYGHACGIKAADDSLWCWGMNDYGQLGDGTLEASFSPREVPGDMQWRTVDAAGRFTNLQLGDDSDTPIYGRTCAITTEDDLYCWGDNQSTPEKMQGSGWHDIDATLKEACALDDGGSAWCWGGRYPSSMEEQPWFSDWQSFSPNGQGGGCGIREDGSAWCIDDGEPVRINEFVVKDTE